MYHMSDCLRPSYTAYASGLLPKHVERSPFLCHLGIRSTCFGRRPDGDGKNFDYLGVTLYVLRQVQPIYGMSHLLNEAVVAEARLGDRVFDVGTSCGIHGILTTCT